MKNKKSILFLSTILLISITLLLSGCGKKTVVNPQPKQQNQISNNTNGQLPGQLTNSDNENINSDSDLSGDSQEEVKKVMTVEEIQEKLKKFDSLQEEPEETNLSDKDIEEFN